MCGPQIGFFIEKEINMSFFRDLYLNILQRINESLDTYNLDPNLDLSFIELTIIEHVSLPDLKLKYFPKVVDGIKVEIPKGFVSNLDIHRNFNNQLFPLTLDRKYYGTPLDLIKKREYLSNI